MHACTKHKSLHTWLVAVKYNTCGSCCRHIFSVGVEGVGSGKMGLPYSIAEVEDEDSSRLNITGHSSAILSETFIGAAIHARAES